MPELTNHLKEIIKEEKRQRDAGELPDSAPAPIMKRKTFKQLGSPTAQAALGYRLGVGLGKCVTDT